MMNWFDNLSLRGKLILNFLISGGVLVAAIIFCIIQIKAVGRGTDELAKNWLPSVQAAGEISQLRLRYRVRSLEYLMPKYRRRTREDRKITGRPRRQTVRSAEEIRAAGRQRRGAQGAAAGHQGAADYKATVLEAIALAKAGKQDEAQQLRKTTWVKAADFMRDQTDQLQKINREGADKSALAAASDVAAATNGGTIALIAGIALAFICTFLIAARMSARLAATVDGARQIARATSPPATLRQRR